MEPDVRDRNEPSVRLPKHGSHNAPDAQVTDKEPEQVWSLCFEPKQGGIQWDLFLREPMLGALWRVEIQAADCRSSQMWR